ncbi:prephenate dehydrogenase [Paenibacillus turpanensis]|uniref:prephenate dehydrogenase n=1 Tax=Paenibacillus turpanensis TaxID=2689078 RepID=UPI0014096975|nr:prephenate dehydrogenase [Paenibacillus turpanensis]
MTKITIYGVGLIGGSLALCFKGKPGFHVVGHSSNPASVEKYVKREVVDEATTSFEAAAEGADFIFLCVPVGLLESYLQRLAELPLRPGCIITDVGSTKANIAHCAQQIQLPEGVCFIGGHPMAGKEQSGVEAATSLLYENAYYVLTPDQATPPDAIQRLQGLLAHTRANLVTMDPQKHDDIVGAISHLPHIIAVALVGLVARYNGENGLHEQLAAGGFRDITRIASSDPIVWRDILLSNRDVMLRLLQDWNREIADFVRVLEQGDGEEIIRKFTESGDFRRKLPERRKGIITAQYDLYVDIPDHPGVIGRIASILGEHKINLRNIHIMESRLDVPGVLRLSFADAEDQERAVPLLKQLGYEVNL